MACVWDHFLVQVVNENTFCYLLPQSVLSCEGQTNDVTVSDLDG